MFASTVSARRQAAAEAAFARYQFDRPIDAASGWESEGDEMVRTIFIDSPCGSSSERAHFVVRFAPESADIAEAFARDLKGEDFGWPA